MWRSMAFSGRKAGGLHGLISDTSRVYSESVLASMLQVSNNILSCCVIFF